VHLSCRERPAVCQLDSLVKATLLSPAASAAKEHVQDKKHRQGNANDPQQRPKCPVAHRHVMLLAKVMNATS